MADETAEIRRINWGECLGFLQLFRAFRLAINPTRLLLAVCGILALYIVGQALDLVWPTSAKPVVIVSGGLSTSELDYFVLVNNDVEKTRQWIDETAKLKGADRVGVSRILFDQFRVTANRLTTASLSLSIGGIIDAIIVSGQTKMWLFKLHLGYAIFFSIASLAIFALVGAAVTRSVALEISRDEKIGPREAMRFASKHFSSFFLAPLFPLGLLLLGAIILWIAGLVGAVPFFGEFLVGWLFFLALLVGFVMAFVTVGAIAGGWLMYPAMGVDGSDAFDALSRAYNYVYARPWRTGFYLLLSMIYGAICLTFVKIFVRIMLVLVHCCLGSSMNYDHVKTTNGANIGKLEAMWQAPSIELGKTAFYGGFADHKLASGWERFCQFGLRAWIFVLVALVGAFALTFACSSFTIIYYLLRRDVDATGFDDINLDDFGGASSTTAASPAPPAGPPAAGSSGTSLPVLGQH